MLLRRGCNLLNPAVLTVFCRPQNPFWLSICWLYHDFTEKPSKYVKILTVRCCWLMSPWFFMLITRSKWSKVPKLSSVFDMRSLTPSRRESESVTLGSFKSRSQSCKQRSALVFSRLKNIEKSSAHLTTSVKSLLILRKSLFCSTFYHV